MDYDVKDVNGVLHTHLSERAIALMIDDDSVDENSPMKKSLMPTWKTVSDFPFLSDALAAQKVRLANLTYEEMSEEQRKRHDEEERKFIPVSAPLKPRFMAFLHDLGTGVLRFVAVLVVALVAVAILAESTTSQEEPPAPKMDKKKIELPVPLPADGAPRSWFDAAHGFQFAQTWAPQGESSVSYVCVSDADGKARWIAKCTLDSVASLAVFVFFLWELFVLAWPLVMRGQTAGMSKCGVQLADANDLRTGVSPFRAFLYALIGVVTLPAAFLCALACKRTINELILKLRVIA